MEPYNKCVLVLLGLEKIEVNIILPLSQNVDSLQKNGSYQL